MDKKNPELTYLHLSYTNKEAMCAEVLNEVNRLLTAGEGCVSRYKTIFYDYIV